MYASRIPNRVSVHERVDISDTYGHWEIDLIGASSKSTVLALAEKKTRFVLFHKIPNKTAHTVQYAILFALRKSQATYVKVLPMLMEANVCTILK